MPIKDWNEPNCWLTSITLNGEITPTQLIDTLAVENIESRPIWKPMHLQPVFKQYDYIGSNVGQRLFETGVCLPSDTKMSNDDLSRVVKVIKGLWENV